MRCETTPLRAHVCQIRAYLCPDVSWRRMTSTAGDMESGHSPTHMLEFNFVSIAVLSRRITLFRRIPSQNLCRDEVVHCAKRKDVGFCLNACYRHPNSNLPYPQRVNDALWKWVDSENGLWSCTDNACIGPCNPDNQSSSGQKLHTFLQKHHMSATKGRTARRLSCACQ